MGRRKRGYGAKKQVCETSYLNDRTYLFYLDLLSELAIATFEWKNFPPEIDLRFLETTLNEKGYGLFFKDDILNEYLALTCTIGGKWDVYNRPIDRKAFASNGYQKNLTNKDSVLIYNNYARRPTLNQIQLYAERLYRLERTIDVNISSQKMPVIIMCSESQRMTMRNLIQQWDEFEPFIYGCDNLDLTGVQVLKTGAEFIADKTQTLKMQIFNEALTYIGISNTNTTKKERMISDEVTQNGEATEMCKNTRLSARKDACKIINAMFGLNTSVEYRIQSDEETESKDSQESEDTDNE